MGKGVLNPLVASLNYNARLAQCWGLVKFVQLMFADWQPGRKYLVAKNGYNTGYKKGLVG